LTWRSAAAYRDGAVYDGTGGIRNAKNFYCTPVFHGPAG
jgi:hypothetical protein